MKSSTSNGRCSTPSTGSLPSTITRKTRRLYGAGWNVPASKRFKSSEPVISSAEGRCSMRLGIDASNLRSGGGLRHLIELLRAAVPSSSGFSEVHVWGGKATLDHLKDRPWLIKSYQPLLDRGLLSRSFWQRFRLSQLASSAECDLVLVPGGSY